MKQQNVVPNATAYNVVISACEKARQPDRALELFGMMKQQQVLPNLNTHNALMQVLASTGQIVAGFELFAQAESFGGLSHSDQF